jgi:hypothetical protein
MSEIEVMASRNKELLFVAGSDKLLRLVAKNGLKTLLERECIELFSTSAVDKKAETNKTPTFNLLSLFKNKNSEDNYSKVPSSDP